MGEAEVIGNHGMETPMPLDMGPTHNLVVAEHAGLTYAADNQPGIRRVGAARGVRYIGPDGRPVRDAATLERIRLLVIPPAYTDVWINRDPHGHIQATGRDQRGRKQYRYHPRWRAVRDETKFARMAEFGRALPTIRERVDSDLRKRELCREKVLAAVVRLMELTLIRVGNDEYARTNKSFGLTTLRDRHVRFEGEQVKFAFKGKSGVDHTTSVRDRRLARIVRACQDVPGQRLFQYYDAEGARHAVGSSDVNAYIREAAGDDFSAKDFRTWAGTIAAAKALALQDPPTSEGEAKRAMALCVRATAGLLGNTPAVCRAAYIHPEVLKAFAEQSLPKAFKEAEGADYEAAVLKFLDALSET